MIVRFVYRPNRSEPKSIRERGPVVRQKQRWIAFLGSLLTHSALVAALAFVPPARPTFKNSPGYAQNPFAPRYTLTILHLPPLAETQPPVVREAQTIHKKPVRQQRPVQPVVVPAPPTESAAQPETAIARETRPFVEPSPLRKLPDLQMPILESGPDLAESLQQSIPLPLSPNFPNLRSPSRQFIAPSVPAQTKQPSLAAAPMVDAPNVEVASGNATAMPIFVDDFARVIRVPTTPAPTSRQTAPQPDLAASPPNSLAPKDRGAGSNTGLLRSGGPGVQAISISGNLAGLNTIVAPDAGATQDLAGLSRIVQPANGKFAVVIQGSPDSTRYPASAGVLAGRVVYTVYLRLGMRRNWVLQYTIPRDDRSSGIGRGPIESPWPVLMMRPEAISTQPNYVLVHGKITATGDFDQLSMVFPLDFDEKELLLKSLRMWKFRPADRDGEAIAVEVLLIIPQQTN